MGGLSRFEKDRAVVAYEKSREISPEGVWVTRTRRYEEHSCTDSGDDYIDVEVLRGNTPKNPTKETPVRKPEKLDNISFMILMNSICLFFVLIAVFIRAVFG